MVEMSAGERRMSEARVRVRTRRSGMVFIMYGSLIESEKWIT
jgi:hypothetical protein